MVGKPLHRSTPTKTHMFPRPKAINEATPLTILNVNCQSVKSKVPQFLNLIESTEPDIILGTESWLSPDIHDSECFQSGYSVYRKDRNVHGGGVFILVRSTITSTEVVEIEPKAEEIWVKVSLEGSRDFYVVCCHYRPSITDKTSIPFLSDSLNRLGNINGHIHWRGFQFA